MLKSLSDKLWKMWGTADIALQVFSTIFLQPRRKILSELKLAKHRKDLSVSCGQIRSSALESHSLDFP